MPTTRLTRDEVAQAIDVLKRQGIPDPGVHRLRAFLGRGSVTTIARHKAELRQIALENLAPNTEKTLPDPVSQRAKELWDTLLAAVDGVEQEVHTAASQRIEKAQRQVETLTGERDKAQEQLHRLEEDLKTAHSENAQRTLQFHSLETQLSELSGRLSAGQALIASLQAREQDLKATLSESARQAVLREKELNNQLTGERERAFALQRQAAQQREQLEADIRTLHDRLAGQREYTEKTIATLQENIHHLEDSAQEHLKEHEALQDALTALRTKYETLQQAANRNDKALAHMEATLLAKNREIGTLKMRLKETQTYHKETKGTYDRAIQQLEARVMELKKSVHKKTAE
jgi:chromosome segregation ATPase